jgi:hypothetical protein
MTMVKPEAQRTCTMRPSTEGFDYWMSSKHVGEATRREIADADILLVPKESFRDRTGTFYPVGTEEFLDFLRENAAHGGVKVDICSENAAYREFALHSDILHLAYLLVKEVALPLVAQLIVLYVSRHPWASKTDRAVNLKITVQESSEGEPSDHQAQGRTLEISYDGPPDAVKDALDGAAKNIREAWRPSR